MKHRSENNDKRPRERFAVRLIRIAVINSARGLRKLSTPAGFLAMIPLVVSVAAYVRSSIETSRLNLFINEPLAFEMRCSEDKPSSCGVNYAHPSDFEFFLTTSGPNTIYVRHLMVNVVAEKIGSDFNEGCDYVVSSSDRPNVSHVVPPFELLASVLNKDYPYELNTGFVMVANTVVPMSGRVRTLRNEQRDERIGRALGAVKDTSTDYRTVALIMDFLRDPSADVAVCISGTAFVAGSDAQKIFWSSSSRDGGVAYRFRDEREEAPPVAPGGESQLPIQVRRLEILGGELETGVKLFSHRSVNLF